MQSTRIRLAREWCDLTQTELSERTGATQPAIASIEAGRYQASSDLIAKIASATGFGVRFFERGPVPELSAGSLLYRSLASVRRASKTQAQAHCLVSFDLAELLSQRLKSIPVVIPKLSEDPITCARITRSSLGIAPNTPIRNLIRVLEKSGVFVFQLPFETEGLDGFSTWAGVNAARPVVALLGGKHGYRPTFTCAEEIGHLVQHHPLTVSVVEAERQAKLFAQEFLLPEEAMELEMQRPITLSSLADQKAKWGVSIQFLAKRAVTLGYMTPNQNRWLMQQISTQRMRKFEAGDEQIVAEKPLLLKTMASLLYGDPINLSKLSSDSGLSGTQLREIIGLDASKSQVIEFRPRVRTPLFSEEAVSKFK
jgi:Zn-dependent peptidase ImmA (M78 family)/DNA-binding XRE family transcriptional regulator